MISSLLKNRGLRLQLLVGLLLVLGTFPEPSEGLKCYECNQAGDETDCTKTTECDPDFTYCFNVKATDGKDETTAGKLCMHKTHGKCLEEEFGSSCKTVTTKTQAENMQEQNKKCGAKALKEILGLGRKQSEIASFSMCVCDSDLCNTGSSGGHSTSVIITALLTVALYNYT